MGCLWDGLWPEWQEGHGCGVKCGDIFWANRKYIINCLLETQRIASLNLPRRQARVITCKSYPLSKIDWEDQ
jgi:hypothetical protein